MLTSIVYYELNQPANAVENYLLLGLTFCLVAESAELAGRSADQILGSSNSDQIKRMGESKVSKGE